MSDHFAVLQRPRRPWLEVEALKARFHEVSATLHPDVAGTGNAEKFAAASAAYAILSDPVARVRHLLECEAPEQLSLPQAIPNEFADLFMKMAEARQQFEAFHKKEAGASQALARALLAGERQTLLQHAQAMDSEIQALDEAALFRLRGLDAEWDSRPVDAVQRLAELHHRLAYLSKWRAQIRESLFKLQS